MRLRSFALLAGLAAVLLAFWVLLFSGERTGGRRSTTREEATKEGGMVEGDVSQRRGKKGVERRRVDEASRRVRGRILDENGAPPREGTVLLFCASDGAVIRGPGILLDEEGRFESEGCGATSCARFQHPSLIQDGSWVLEPGVEAELRVRALQRLEGTVVDEEGSPVAGARVLVLPEEDDPTAVPPFVSRHAGTDADGSFSFFRVEAPPCDVCGEIAGRCDPDEARELALSQGGIRMTVRARGYRNEERRFDGEEEGPVQLILHPPEAPLRGTLSAPDGGEYPRAVVYLRSQSREERHRARIEAGRFEVSELGEGAYDLEVVQDGIVIWREEGVRPGQELSLQPKAQVSDVVLRLRSGEGKALSGVKIRGGPFKSVQSDRRGEATASRVLAGHYSLSIEHVGHGRLRREIEVEGGQAKEVIELVLP